jgi:hypothetical protein
MSGGGGTSPNAARSFIAWPTVVPVSLPASGNARAPLFRTGALPPC